MESTDELIHGLYRGAVEDEWREYRGRALARVCEKFGASAAAWWTRGENNDGGELTQHPQSTVTAAALAALKFPADNGENLLELPGRNQTSVALYYPHSGTAVVSTVLLNFPSDRKLPSNEAIKRVIGHMIEAGALALRQFIRRDDWLASMGRANRGSAAMVDAEGNLFALSEHFRAMLDNGTGAALAKLPFELPEAVLGEEGGEFVNGPLHMRVTRCGELYLLYARKPLPLDSLSPREQEIARALGNGKTLKSIARQYGIAVSTVANHTTRIYRKLAIYRREDLIELVRMRSEAGRKVG
ncbi:MAG: helix-turn-helix transcriptional regulator [Nevskia sp.]|jgi:DNA-binding CsgD family transcriptional regulator|nr:helix-turn-helix transcriptional regulator [Nevskia sp.]MCK9383232.1 helix-turn-helix transcriptional regulator [Nevskia sp.]